MFLQRCPLPSRSRAPKFRILHPSLVSAAIQGMASEVAPLEPCDLPISVVVPDLVCSGLAAAGTSASRDPRSCRRTRPTRRYRPGLADMAWRVRRPSRRRRSNVDRSQDAVHCSFLSERTRTLRPAPAIDIGHRSGNGAATTGYGRPVKGFGTATDTGHCRWRRRHLLLRRMELWPSPHALRRARLHVHAAPACRS